jgi:hypothetical protein
MPLPWKRPRRELVLLALVAVAALSPVYVVSPQDVSRLCLTRAIVEGHLSVDGCIDDSVDRSRYGGRLYSNKAPGMSILAIPPAEAVRLPPPAQWNSSGDAKLWVVRLLVSGIAFLACALLVGRVTEGLAAGFGGPTLVTFALGTLMAPLAATNFDHVPTAALGFGGFLLAWKRRPLLAGLVSGVAATVEYEALALAGVLAVYVALQGSRSFCRYVIGAVPGVVLLAAYNSAAFGAPWHNPLRYSENDYQSRHAAGLLGIQRPNRHAVELVFVGYRGLLILSPVLIAAAFGLWRFWRQGFRAEAALCMMTCAAFLIAECGYFIPYGGVSPGPRFLVPALPFAAIGMGVAFARLPLATWILAVMSIVATLAITLTWTEDTNYSGTIWGQIVRLPFERGSADVVRHLSGNAFVWLGLSRAAAAGIVFAAAGVALLASAGLIRRRRTDPL